MDGRCVEQEMARKQHDAAKTDDTAADTQLNALKMSEIPRMTVMTRAVMKVVIRVRQPNDVLAPREALLWNPSKCQEAA